MKMVSRLALQLLISTVLITSNVRATTTLETTPSHVNGVLTVYSGDRISLKCSHDNLVSGVTRWSFGAPLRDCSEAIIDHNPPITTSPCGQFTFEDVTEIMLGRLLNSTAVATAASSMSGAVVECRDSTGIAPNLIGRVTLCVTDLPHPPSNVTWSAVSDGRGVISWNPVPQPPCSTRQLSYSVTIVPLPPGSSPLKFTTTQSSTDLSSVQGNTTYFVIVRTTVDMEQLTSTTASTLTFASAGDGRSHNTTPIVLVPSCSTSSPLTPIPDQETTPMARVTSSTSGSCSCNINDSITPPTENQVTTSRPNRQTNCSLDTPAAADDSDSVTLIVAVAVVLTAIVSTSFGLLIGSSVTYFCVKKTSKSDSAVDGGHSSYVVESTNPVYDEINVVNYSTSSQKINMDSNVAYGQSLSRNVSLSSSLMMS